MEQILKISIPTYSKRTNDKPHIIYHISITAPVRSWTIQHRYSDFFELNKKFFELNLRPPVELPPKSSIFSLKTFDNPQFIENRRKGLEEYLQAILSAKNGSDGERFKKTMEWKSFLGISHLKSRNIMDSKSPSDNDNDSITTNTTLYHSEDSSLSSSTPDFISNRNKKRHLFGLTFGRAQDSDNEGKKNEKNNSNYSSLNRSTKNKNLRLSEQWLEECRDLNMIINEIRTCIAAKNKFVSRNETSAACEATILARKNHSLLTMKYQALERELIRQWDEYNSNVILQHEQVQAQKQNEMEAVDSDGVEISRSTEGSPNLINKKKMKDDKKIKKCGGN